jgi:hypothetical protein
MTAADAHIDLGREEGAVRRPEDGEDIAFESTVGASRHGRSCIDSGSCSARAEPRP